MRLAAIDIGSNAIRLYIGNVSIKNKKIRVKKESLIRVPVRLGLDVFYDQEISAKKADKLKEAMIAFRSLLKLYDVEDTIALATSAMRDATNGQMIIEEIHKATDIRIQAITGIEESRLIFGSIVDKLEDVEGKGYLSVDVGGGSTETLVYSNGEILDVRSWNIGTVRLLNDEVKEEDWHAMHQWLAQYNHRFKPFYGIATGGNINKIRKMYFTKAGEYLTHTVLKNIKEHLQSFSYKERVEELGLRPDRADVIIPASHIYERVMFWSGVSRLYIPKLGLADGAIKELYLQKQNSNNK